MPLEEEQFSLQDMNNNAMVNLMQRNHASTSETNRNSTLAKRPKTHLRTGEILLLIPARRMLLFIVMTNRSPSLRPAIIAELHHWHGTASSCYSC